MNVAKRILLFLSFFQLTFAAEHKLLASDPALEDYFGASVAVSGDYSIVGAYADDDAGTGSGSAYIFNRDPGTGNWSQTAKLVASDAAASDQFGYSVDMHGDYAIVGAYGNAHPSYGMGAAYIFQKDAGGEDWIQKAKLIANDAAASDQFGIAVAIDLNYALVGANYDDDNGKGDSGSAYVFKRDLVSHVWTQQDKLTASNATASASIATSVELQGDYAILSSYLNTTESALIFKKNSSTETWSEQAILTPDDWTAGDNFGYSVSISEDYAVVGSRYDDYSSYSNPGSAYIFKRDTGLETWSQTAKLTASDVALGSSSFFGASVAILNRQVIVGAYPLGCGKAYLYDRANGQETWTETVILPQNSISAGQHFGESVDLSGSFVICGAPWDNESYNKSGSAYLIDQSDFSLPVELSSFTASSNQGVVDLTWTTSSEVENLGFILERSPNSLDTWVEIASFKGHAELNGAGSTTRESHYFYTDAQVRVGETYRYRLSDVDYQGKLTRHAPVDILVRDTEQRLMAESFSLVSAYPNPFNPSIAIDFNMGSDGTLTAFIIDVRGRVVKQLINQEYTSKGSHTLMWQGTNTQGQPVSSGIYFLTLQNGAQTHQIKLVKLD